MSKHKTTLYMQVLQTFLKEKEMVLEESIAWLFYLYAESKNYKNIAVILCSL